MANNQTQLLSQNTSMATSNHAMTSQSTPNSKANDTPSRSHRPAAVLYVCTMNAIRSPMAAALTKQYFANSIYSQSAGVHSGKPDPFVKVVMEEIGIDLSHHQPHCLDDLGDTNFDLLVTMTSEAHDKALEIARTHACAIEYWPTDDPSLSGGSRMQILHAYRCLRDMLIRRIHTRFN